MTDCDNWRGITLIPVIMKIFGSVIINRIRVGVDNKLRNEQAGYRQSRNTTEQIFVLRNIIEQVIEWNSNLYICFVDFEKAFDSVHRETLLRLLKIYGIPDKPQETHTLCVFDQLPVVSWRRAKYKQMYGLKSTLTVSR